MKEALQRTFLYVHIDIRVRARLLSLPKRHFVSVGSCHLD